MSTKRKAPWLLVLDIGLPVGLYYGLKAAGVSDLNALLVGTVPPLISSAVSFARKRRTDLLGMVVILSLVGSTTVGLLGGDARMLLIRGAWVSLPFAAVTLWSLRHPQPLCFTFTRAFLPRRAAVMDRLWESDPRFRHAWRQITVLWGITSIIDAAVRVGMTYTLPVSVVPALDTVLTVLSVIALQIPTHVLLRRSGTWHLVFSPRGPAALSELP
jgi:hypothetical protein